MGCVDRFRAIPAGCLPVNDFEITDRALFVQEMVTSPRRVRLVAGDYSMLFRGRSLGLETLQIPRLESGDRDDDSNTAAIQAATEWALQRRRYSKEVQQPLRPAPTSYDRYRLSTCVNDQHRPLCHSFTPRWSLEL